MQEYSNQRHDNIQLLLQAEQQASQLVQQARQSKYQSKIEHNSMKVFSASYFYSSLLLSVV